MRNVLLLLGVAICLIACDAKSRRLVDGKLDSKVHHSIPVPKYNNSRPLIGILSQPCTYCPGKSYIAAGYVKLIEAAGGRAVPIRFYASDAELYRIFKSINGIMFAGGLTWCWLDAPYTIAARKLFNWAKEANDRGDVFPLHGTCLGHQLLQILAANISRNFLLVDTDSIAHATTVKWTKDAYSSRMFGGMSTNLMEAMEDPAHSIAFENHYYGTPPSFYDQGGKFAILKDFYHILSTTLDRNGTEYISTIEAKKYPFTGTQWHPEKPPFEFGMLEIPHTLPAVQVSQHMANYFIDTARQSKHKPESLEAELALEIYDIPPTFSIRFETTDEENYDGPDITYYLDKKDSPPEGPDDLALRDKDGRPTAKAMQMHRKWWSTQNGMF